MIEVPNGPKSWRDDDIRRTLAWRWRVGGMLPLSALVLSFLLSPARADPYARGPLSFAFFAYAASSAMALGATFELNYFLLQVGRNLLSLEGTRILLCLAVAAVLALFTGLLAIPLAWVILYIEHLLGVSRIPQPIGGMLALVTLIGVPCAAAGAAFGVVLSAANDTLETSLIPGLFGAHVKAGAVAGALVGTAGFAVPKLSAGPMWAPVVAALLIIAAVPHVFLTGRQIVETLPQSWEAIIDGQRFLRRLALLTIAAAVIGYGLARLSAT